MGGSDDFEAPTFVDMSLSRNFVDVSSGPQGVIFDVDFDDASGIEGIRVHLNFEKPDGSIHNETIYWQPDELAGDDCSNSDTYAGGISYERCLNEFVFDSDDFAGIWKISGVAGYDKVGNQNWIDTDELEAAGVETLIEVSKNGSIEDSDGDGFSDLIDNCPTISNSDQLDFDSDGQGDVCDDDDDNDSVADGDDEFPLDPTETVDSDGDGMGDNADDFPNNAGVQTFRVADSSFSVNILPQGETEVIANVLATVEPPPDPQTIEFYLGQPPSCGDCLTSIVRDTGQFDYDWSEDSAHQDQFSIVVQYQGEVLEANIDVAFNTDPLYKHQWHLENTGQDNFTNYAGSPSEDLRVAAPITSGYTGEGVLVAIVDDGLELAHEDLAGNIVSGSRDFVEDDDDPTNPSSDSGHGTAVAGIVAAEGWNNIGVRGAAPSASLVGYNFLEFQTSTSLYASFGQETYSSVVDIFNASLGAAQSALMPSGNYEYSSEGVLFATEVLSLRDGKGAIIVKSSGNDFDVAPTEQCGNDSGSRVSCVDANVDWWHQYPSMIVTAALRADGLKSSYSSPGSMVWISGFGGEYGYDSTAYSLPEYIKGPAIMSTDKASCDAGYSAASGQARNAFEPGWLGDDGYRHPDNADCNYLSIMNGTSSAAPSVSGAIALVLEANPDLSYREVKHILAATARQVDPTFAPVIIDGISYHEWRTNAAGYHHHNWYGFGAIDAEAAVSYAENWDTSVYPFNPQEVSTWEFSTEEQIPILVVNNDGSGEFSANAGISNPSSGLVEYVTIDVNLETAAPNGYGLRLVSPSGTVSSLLHPHTAISELYEGGAILSSAAFYGEEMFGAWTLEVYDHLNDGNSVALNDWALKFHYRQP